MITRRRFLGLTAAAGAAAALPYPLRNAAAAPLGSAAGGSLGKIEHVVILIQENRSFDTYFGTLSGVRGFSDRHALKLPNGRPVFYQSDALNPDGYELPFHLDTHTTSAAAVADTSHAWDVQHQTWDGGKMDLWLPAHRAADGPYAGTMTMGYHTRADLPFHFALAEAFTICDGYYCSVFGPTNPNRLYSMTATLDPQGKNGGPVIDNSEKPWYTWTTYPERLQQAGISWRVYQETDNYDDNPLAWFQQYQDKSTPLYQNGMATRSASAFADDVAADKLPQVSWIIGPAASTEHPSYLPAAGADYSRRLLAPFAEHEDVWNKTALFLTWDENDGFFDHVVPPTPRPGTPDEFVGGLPIGLGYRVPTIVISPYSTGGYVCSDTFDHTSLIRFLEQRFGVREPNISAWRRAVCGDLTSTFDFDAEPAPFPELPDTTAYLAQQQASTALPPPTVPLHQTMPVQEPGTRPRRGSSRDGSGSEDRLVLRA
jgi:phospholipase C